MENLGQINYILFGENIIPDIAKNIEMQLSYPLNIKISISKQDVILGLQYSNIYNIKDSQVNFFLNTFDFNLAIFVCNLQDENNLDKLKNSKEFKDLKDYIAKKIFFLL